VSVITKIQIQKNKKAFNIFLDGKYSFSLNPLVFLQANLKKDQTLSDKQIKDLTFSSDFQRYYDLAINFISFRPRSEKETKDYLKKKLDKENSDDLVFAIINKLKEKKFVDDDSFVDWWIEQRLAFKYKSKIVLKSELLKKGLDRQLIERKLSDKFDCSTETNQALELARKRIQRWKNYPWSQVKIKITRYLSGKGYSWDVVSTALEELGEKE